MKIIKPIYILLFFLLAPNSSLFAQEWAKVYRNPSPEIKNAEEKASCIAVDSYGNIYVAGYSTGYQTKTDICLIKYNTNGDTLWTKVFNGTGNAEDKAYAITVDDLDNIYITGYTTTDNAADIVVIKYSSAGALLWLRTYNNSSANLDDIASAMKVDCSGNIYVCGFSTGLTSDADYIVLKYSANGTLLWHKIYNGTGNGPDFIKAIAVGPDNNLVVSGNSAGTSEAGSEDIVTIKYNSSNGYESWIQRFNGSGISNTTDKAYAITVDNGNNVYVAGNTTGVNTLGIIILSYNSQGSVNWIDVYSNPNVNNLDFPCNILCTGDNYVLVSGTTKNSLQAGAEDFITLACHSNNGNFKWVNTYNGPNNGMDVVCAMSLSESENEVYVSGYSSRGSQFNILDMVTIEYKLANGELVDSMRFNNTGIDKDSPVGMAVDAEGNIFITGWTIPNYGNQMPISVIEDSDILTVKYAFDEKMIQNSSDNKNISNNGLLSQNFPNPFNPVTVIKVKLLNPSRVELKIYDMLGKEIQTLASCYLEAGEHNFRFDGGNLSSGTYFYELNTDGVKDIKKMILLK